MSHTYTTILNLTLLHDYYTDGFCPDFVIMPTPATACYLSRRRLLFKATAHGCYICCDAVTLSTLPQLLAERTLSFQLVLKNKHFMNFTDLPTRSGGKDVYFLRPSILAGISPTIETVSLSPPIFTYSFTAVNNISYMRVVDSGGNQVFREMYTGTVGQPVRVPMDLSQHPYGLYRFLVGEELINLVYISDDSDRNQLFGLVDVFIPNIRNFDFLESYSM